MDFPLLVAQTPRAGRWHNQTLLPPGELPPGLRPLDFVAAARVTEVGANYVAAAVEVEQPTTGRRGPELLVLVGVNPPDGSRLDELKSWIRNRIGDLVKLIAEYPWETHDGSDVRLPQLSAWSQAVVADFKLPQHPKPTSPLANGYSGSQRRRVKISIWIFVILLMGFVSVVIWLVLAGRDVGAPTQAGANREPPAKVDRDKKGDDEKLWIELMAEFAPESKIDSKEHNVIEKNLILALAEVLNKELGPFERPLVDEKRFADVRKWVIGHQELKLWLKGMFPKEQRKDGWQYFGPDKQDRRRLERAMGKLESVADVRGARARLDKIRAFLVACQKEKPKSTDLPAGWEGRYLTVWMKKLSGLEELSRIEPLPFFKGDDWVMLLNRMRDLRQTLVEDGLIEPQAEDPDWKEIQELAKIGREVTGFYRKPDSGKKPKSVERLEGKYAGRPQAPEEYEAVKTLLAELSKLAEND